MRLRSEKKGNEASLKLQLYTCDIFYFTENLKQRQNVRLPQLHSRPHDLLNYDVIVSHSWRIMFPPPPPPHCTGHSNYGHSSVDAVLAVITSNRRDLIVSSHSAALMLCMFNC